MELLLLMGCGFFIFYNFLSSCFRLSRTCGSVSIACVWWRVGDVASIELEEGTEWRSA
jgi:hypothetical protein